MAREEAGLNQKDLADRLGLSQSTLSNYEKGKRKLYLAQLKAIADQLGKPLEYFLRPIDMAESSGEHMTNKEAGLDQLVEIINVLRELPESDRKSVYDFARWLKSRREGL